MSYLSSTVVLIAVLASTALSQESCQDSKTVVASASRPARVFVVAGQSNAVGYNDIKEYKQGRAEFPKFLKRQPDVLFWHAEERKQSPANNWKALSVADSGAFGPEISFAYDLAKAMPNERVAIIKCAVGGTGIARSRDYRDYIPALSGFDDHGNNWHPPSEVEKAGLLYQRLIVNIQNALSSLDSQSVEWQLSGFIWMQGEHEAGISQEMAKDYDELLAGFISSVRKDLKSPTVPFAIGEINSHTWVYGDIARKNQAKVCQQDRNAVLIKTTDISRIGSGGAAHFDADGMLVLGSRFAKAIMRFLQDESSRQVSSKSSQKDDLEQ